MSAPLSPYLASVLAGMHGFAPRVEGGDVSGGGESGPGPYLVEAPPPESPPPPPNEPIASFQPTAPVEPQASVQPIGPPAPPVREPTSFTRGDAPANTNAVPGGPASAANVNAPDGGFELQPMKGSGAVVPAHEVDLRGPTHKAAMANANAATEGAIQAVDQRSEDAAVAEYGMALQQEREARAREAAWHQSQAEREEEMAQRQADFDQSVQALSQTSIDPNRFWSTRSTGQKVAAMVSLALGGFLQGARGGSNPGMDIINTAIDRDVRAQEAQFQAARDTASARQTAFAMAAQKYQNLDAARAMARAAAIDAVQAQLAQNAALWKGTDAANRATAAMAQLQQDKLAQSLQFIRFILPQQAPRMFVDPKTGLRYSEQEAKGLAATLRGQEFEREKLGMQTAGQILAKRAEQEGEMQMSGGLGKAGAQQLAVEEAKAKQERDANLKAINNAMENLPAIVKGGYLGTAAAKTLPAGVPGVTEATNDMNAREAYNNRAMLAVAAAYKLSTDATEPKNLTILEHYSAPYVVKPGDNEAVARDKMSRLKNLVTESAAAKGPLPPPKATLPASFTAHGGK